MLEKKRSNQSFSESLPAHFTKIFLFTFCYQTFITTICHILYLKVQMQIFAPRKVQMHFFAFALFELQLQKFVFALFEVLLHSMCKIKCICKFNLLLMLLWIWICICTFKCILTTKFQKVQMQIFAFALSSKNKSFPIGITLCFFLKNGSKSIVSDRGHLMLFLQKWLKIYRFR